MERLHRQWSDAEVPNAAAASVARVPPASRSNTNSPVCSSAVAVCSRAARCRQNGGKAKNKVLLGLC